MLSTKEKNLIKEYESVKLELIELEERAKELKETILPLLKPEEKLQLDFGKLYLKPMPKFSFSPVVERLEEAVKVEKEKEKADGTAEMTVNYILEYRRDKKEEEE